MLARGERVGNAGLSRTTQKNSAAFSGMFGFRAPADTTDAMLASFSSEAVRVLIVLLQLAVSFIIGTVVVALWTGEAKDSWLHSAYRLLRSSFEFILSMVSQGNVTSEARLGRATLADIAKEAVAANKDVEAPLGSEEHRPSRWQAAALSATSTDEQGAAAVSDVSKLRKIGSKSAANLNLGNLGDLQAKRRQEVFASIFERDFGLELSVAAAIGLAHWMHGRGLLDWLFLLLWATACVALVASRGRRLLLYAEARQGLAKVERATMQAEGELPRRLRDGTIRLVHVDWLLEHASALATSGGGIACHQDLPAEAFVPSAEALALLESTPGSLAALSYGWLSPAHPDPYGFHLRAVAAWLHKHGGSVRAIFWDWLSLPQRRPKVGRTTEEQARFQRSLEVMLHLYASPRVLVLQHKNMPSQHIFSDLFSEALNTRPYEKRGWYGRRRSGAPLRSNPRDHARDTWPQTQLIAHPRPCGPAPAYVLYRQVSRRAVHGALGQRARQGGGRGARLLCACERQPRGPRRAGRAPREGALHGQGRQGARDHAVRDVLRDGRRA